MQRCSRLTAANIPAPVSVLPAATGSLLELSAQAYPDNEAVVSVQQGIRLTYGELLRQADEIARGLLALGVQVRAC
jgi:fatty-acyl-CoA synthase